MRKHPLLYILLLQWQRSFRAELNCERSSLADRVKCLNQIIHAKIPTPGLFSLQQTENWSKNDHLCQWLYKTHHSRHPLQGSCRSWRYRTPTPEVWSEALRNSLPKNGRLYMFVVLLPFISPPDELKNMHDHGGNRPTTFRMLAQCSEPRGQVGLSITLILKMNYSMYHILELTWTRSSTWIPKVVGSIPSLVRHIFWYE